jgi:hypothetical protein
MKLKAPEWIDLLAADHPPATERVILITKLRKSQTLYIPKAQWSQHFSHFGGIDFNKDREIELTSRKNGGNKIELPQWVMRQLAAAPGDWLCITQRTSKYYLKKLEFGERATDIPGNVVVDTFRNTRVKRVYSIQTDLDSITYASLNRLISQMGRFRRDPISPLKSMDGRIGFLARKELLGGFTRKDKDAIRDYKQQIINRQQPNGSWASNTVETAFNLIRLIEVGETTRTHAVGKAAGWLLSTDEPVGLPGLFMFSQDLVCRFNKWKERPGAEGRPYRKHVRGEMQEFLDNVDILPNVSNTLCELRVTWASAIAIEALLRAGLADEDRVIRAINTLLAVRRGRWCGCGYLDAKADIPPSHQPVDFNRSFPVPLTNADLYRLNWFATAADARKIACNGDYRALDIGSRKALLVKHFRTTGDCSVVVHRALSCHPKYRGSNLETCAAFECASRQSSYGTWGDAYLSCMFDSMERFRHPLSGFLILRSIPLLIRNQRPDGLWHEERKQRRLRFLKEPAPPPPEVATYMILKALKRYGFLRALCPR